MFCFYIQVQQLFPHMPTSTVIEDLRVTRSVELTIENILDGRLIAPAIFREPEIIAPNISTTLTNTQKRLNTTLTQWDNMPDIPMDRYDIVNFQINLN